MGKRGGDGKERGKMKGGLGFHKLCHLIYIISLLLLLRMGTYEIGFIYSIVLDSL